MPRLHSVDDLLRLKLSGFRTGANASLQCGQIASLSFQHQLFFDFGIGQAIGFRQELTSFHDGVSQRGHLDGSLFSLTHFDHSQLATGHHNPIGSHTALAIGIQLLVPGEHGSVDRPHKVNELTFAQIQVSLDGVLIVNAHVDQFIRAAGTVKLMAAGRLGCVAPIRLPISPLSMRVVISQPGPSALNAPVRRSNVRSRAFIRS